MWVIYPYLQLPMLLFKNGPAWYVIQWNRARIFGTSHSFSFERLRMVHLSSPNGLDVISKDDAINVSFNEDRFDAQTWTDHPCLELFNSWLCWWISLFPLTKRDVIHCSSLVPNAVHSFKRSLFESTCRWTKLLMNEEVHDESENDQVQSVTRWMQYVIYPQTSMRFCNKLEHIGAH